MNWYRRRRIRRRNAEPKHTHGRTREELINGHSSVKCVSNHKKRRKEIDMCSRKRVINWSLHSVVDCGVKFRCRNVVISTVIKNDTCSMFMESVRWSHWSDFNSRSYVLVHSEHEKTTWNLCTAHSTATIKSFCMSFPDMIEANEKCTKHYYELVNFHFHCKCKSFFCEM